MTCQLLKQGGEIRSVGVHERGNVIFVEPNTRKIALSVKGGKRVQFEQQQSLYGRTWNVSLSKGLDGGIPLLDPREKRIAGQPNINL